MDTIVLVFNKARCEWGSTLLWSPACLTSSSSIEAFLVPPSVVIATATGRAAGESIALVAQNASTSCPTIDLATLGEICTRGWLTRSAFCSTCDMWISHRVLGANTLRADAFSIQTTASSTLRFFFFGNTNTTNTLESTGTIGVVQTVPAGLLVWRCVYWALIRLRRRNRHSY